MTSIATRCCIVGGGPAGMMLGFLLARAGVDVVVLEKHADFLRDFRGDTVHPSTLNVMDELGLLADFLKLPHQEISRFSAQFGDERVVVADFSHLPVRSCTVERVTHDRMMQRRKVHANLVCAPGVKLHFDQCCSVDSSQQTPVRARFAGIREHGAATRSHTRAALGVSSDGELDAATVLL